MADFSWSPAGIPGSEQRLVLSDLPAGLDSGAFVQTPPLAPSQSSYRWRRLNPGTAPRYWRVLTRHGDAWAASETSTFNGVECG